MHFSVFLSKRTFLFFPIKPNPLPPTSLGDTWGSGGLRGGDNLGPVTIFPKCQKRQKRAKKIGKSGLLNSTEMHATLH